MRSGFPMAAKKFEFARGAALAGDMVSAARAARQGLSELSAIYEASNERRRPGAPPSLRDKVNEDRDRRLSGNGVFRNVLECQHVVEDVGLKSAVHCAECGVRKNVIRRVMTTARVKL